MTAPGGEPRARVLVVDAKAPSRRALARAMQARGFRAEAQEDEEGALGLLEAMGFDVVLASAELPEGGLSLLDRVKARRPAVEVVLIAGPMDGAVAEEAFRRGAFATVGRAADDAELGRLVERAAERSRLSWRVHDLESHAGDEAPSNELVSSSRAMRDAKRLGKGVAKTRAPVLLVGEPGTGKEAFARWMHREGPRATRPFEALDAAVLPAERASAELFGGGAGRDGLLQRADGGTAYVAGIESLPAGAQRELAAWLDDGRLPVPGAAADVRLVAATSADLRERVREGRFLDDLYFRVAVFPIHLPPLRRRKEDIPVLAYQLLKKHAAQLGRDVRYVGTEAMRALREQPWPGNVPELESALAHAVASARGETVTPADLPFGDAPPRKGPRGASWVPDGLDALPYGEAKERLQAAFEAHYVASLLERAGGNRTRAAAAAGMDRSNFRKLVKRARGGGGAEPGREDDPASQEDDSW